MFHWFYRCGDVGVEEPTAQRMQRQTARLVAGVGAADEAADL